MNTKKTTGHQPAAPPSRLATAMMLAGGLLTSTAALANPVQWQASQGGNGHWYELIDNDPHLCWLEAEAYAETIGGQLASLETLSEFEFARALVYAGNGPYDTMIGLKQDEDGAEPAGGWRWVSGEPLAYNQWASTLDDAAGCQDWAAFADGSGYGKLDDIYPCEGCVHTSYQRRMLVEWTADCNGDGIVDYGQILDGSLADEDGNGVPDTCESSPGTITVCPTCDYTSIQEAMNASSDGDVIQIGPGIYHEYSLDPGGKAITIQGTLHADGSLATTIDAQQMDRVWTVASSEGPDTVLADLVITGGYTLADGAGILCDNTSPTITNCAFIDNVTVNYGGGIRCFNGSNPDISHCRFVNNSSAGGGGIHCYQSSDATISDCEFTMNSASESGGAITSYNSSPEISNCLISGNTADSSGGGIWIFSSNGVTVMNCTIQGNSATTRGGGLNIQGSLSVNVHDCDLENNQAPNGGGAFLDPYSSLTVSTCHFEGNQADGGAIQNQQGTLVLLDSSFVANTGYDGGAIYCWSAQLDVENCLFQDNVAADDGGAMLLGGVTQATITASRFCGNTAPNGQHILGSFQDGGDNSFADICNCSGDVNDDGVVNVTDILIVIAEYGSDSPLGDVNDDGLVDVNDLLQVLTEFGLDCG
ncbi:MAG: right-handed parallel beta-helix repeat-containing protein [Phycisphaerales bacterium]|nr:right-handed parallel beta-helix repeat-containing protein [Phycisphaerales bacterium]